MSRVFRFVLMWLVALAIPLQGLASAVAPLCETAGHTPAAIAAFHPAITLAVTHQQPGSGNDEMHRGHGAHHGATTAQPDSASDSTAHAGTADPAVHGGHACCGAAAAGAAVFAFDLFARQPAPSHVPVAPVAQRYQGVILDGLDRPPRIFLA